ncbi:MULTISPECIES: TetR/AcrR family transcriptional regulator C-terminal domain-containing protein [unclassified Paenibacillus]|uniref:TetR/AcrR family transcriptional regulator n=1 Tax=unclassified Paenibacillus TaxID=185978 RepID=UPI0010428AF1|nr:MULTISPECIES: TetR/AcrR family transcriptional regulator C-terminal domain-containing protein [unclassified Paenibacillus]NIK67144.1 AcrR family transcriptional regulator [Paenibacillus sp. BK720]TCN01189.1 TetR family transcriptional regulator [Paenibacillus sp. BK033]
MEHGDEEDVLKSLPRGVALAWGLVKESQRGPKRELSIDQIVAAAVELADKEGLQAVSMSRVASSLGFTAMSLYRYVQSKDDLLLLMQESVCKLPDRPEEEEADWREGMRQYVRDCIHVFLKHPWYADIPVSGVPLTPNNLLFVDLALRPMRKLPLNDFEKMSTVLLLSNYARSTGQIQRDMVRAIEGGASPGSFSGLDYTKALKILVKEEHYPDLQPLIASGVYTEENPADNPIGNDFDFGLERILDGIEHYLASKG